MNHTAFALYTGISHKPSARAILGEYWPEVLTVRTKHSEVNTKRTGCQYSPSTAPNNLDQ